mmetsp:Transcript_3097/g.4340  ORF Transcript_3097/g.4340 Transcript_3097/m.4340 type:complete len:1187 (+) Transcript_3097:405-3965(+)
MDDGQLHNKRDIECLQTEDRIMHAVRKSQCAVILLTKRYSDKVSQTKYENDLQTEYQTIFKLKGVRYMIPVILEKYFQPLLSYDDGSMHEEYKSIGLGHLSDSMAYTTVSDAEIEKISAAADSVVLWNAGETCKSDNMLYKLFKEKPCVNMMAFESSSDQCDQLYQHILKAINPLRNGGHYKKSNYVYSTTVTGRHFAWFRHHMPDAIDHITAQRFANILTQQGVETTIRLWSVIQADPSFLTTKLEASTELAALIKQTVRADIGENLKIENIREIDNTIEKQRRDFLAIIDKEHVSAFAYIDTAIFLTERVNMLKEDNLSYSHREHAKSLQFESSFQSIKNAMISASEDENRKFSDSMKSMHDAYEVFQQQLSADKKLSETIRICSITSPADASNALRYVVVKVTTALDKLATPHDVYDDNYSVVSSITELRTENFFSLDERDRHNDVMKANKVKSFIMSTGKEELLELLQESAFIFHGIVNICRRGKAESVRKLVLNMIIKLVMSVMSNAYLFDCTFNSPHIPVPGFQRLNMPIEGLRAIKHICKYGIYPHCANHRIIYAFGDAGGIDLAMECIKFHINDLSIIINSLELLLTLLDSIENEDEHLHLLTRNGNHYILLMILMEKYADSIDVQSCLIMIFSLLMRHNRFDADLETYRAFLICPPLTKIMRGFLASSASKNPSRDSGKGSPKTTDEEDTVDDQQIEIRFRILSAIQNIFFDHASMSRDILTESNDMVHHHHHVPYNLKVTKQLDNCLVIDFIVMHFVDFAKDEFISMAAMHSLANVVYGNDGNKMYCAKLNIQTFFLPVIKNNITVLVNYQKRNGDKNGSTAPNEEQLSMNICKEVLLLGFLVASNLTILHDADIFVDHLSEAYKEFQKHYPKYAKDRAASPKRISPTREGKKGAQKAKEENRQREEERQYTIHKADYMAFRMLEFGIGELILEVLLHLSEDRLILKNTLILLCKLVYKGKYFSCVRLASLGVCEKLVGVMRSHMTDKEIFVLGLEACAGLASSHPVLVGGAKKLLQAKMCNLITAGLKTTCQVEGSKKWPHFNFPYVCKVCVQCCQVVYRMTKQDDKADVQQALDTFREARFQGILVRPPKLLSSALSYDTLLNQRDYNGGVPAVAVSTLEEQLATAAGDLDQEMVEKLHSSDKINYRNVEFTPTMRKEDKDEIMEFIFEIFNIL